MTRKKYDRIDMLCLHINQLEKRLEVLENIVCSKETQTFQRVVLNKEEPNSPIPPQIPIPIESHDTHIDNEEETQSQSQLQPSQYTSRMRFVV